MENTGGVYRRSNVGGGGPKQSVPLRGAKKESFVAPVVDSGNDHWPADGEIRNVIDGSRRPSAMSEHVSMSQRLKCASGVNVGPASMERISARVGNLIDNSSA